MSTKILLNIYYTMIFSHLIYFNFAWGSAAKTVSTPLHILQIKAARLITNQNFKAHANPLFKIRIILTICHIHKLEIAKYTFNGVNDEGAVFEFCSFSSLLCFRVSSGIICFRVSS